MDSECQLLLLDKVLLLSKLLLLDKLCAERQRWMGEGEAGGKRRQERREATSGQVTDSEELLLTFSSWPSAPCMQAHVEYLETNYSVWISFKGI